AQMLVRDLALRERRKIEQAAAVRVRQMPRLHVEYAERAGDEPGAVRERMPGVEPELRFRDDERMSRGARIRPRVRDDLQAVLLEGQPTQREVRRQLGDRPSRSRLEPLLVGVQERDRGDGDPERLPGDTGDPLEALLERRVEEVEHRRVGELYR